MEHAQKTIQSEKKVEEKHALSSDIIRLLDLLARIELRRQTRQRLADKEKAS